MLSKLARSEVERPTPIFKDYLPVLDASMTSEERIKRIKESMYKLQERKNYFNRKIDKLDQQKQKRKSKKSQMSAKEDPAAAKVASKKEVAPPDVVCDNEVKSAVQDLLEVLSMNEIAAESEPTPVETYNVEPEKSEAPVENTEVLYEEKPPKENGQPKEEKVDKNGTGPDEGASSHGRQRNCPKING